MPLEAQLRQRISIEIKQKGLTYIAHSILTSVIFCYKEYIVNVVRFNMRYRNRNILLPETTPQKGRKQFDFFLHC